MNLVVNTAFAAASLTLSLSAVATVEGEWWEMTATMEMAGMPAMPGGPPTRFCRVKGDESKPVQSKEEKNCTVSNVKNVGNTMTFNMKCTGHRILAGEMHRQGCNDRHRRADQHADQL